MKRFLWIVSVLLALFVVMPQASAMDLTPTVKKSLGTSGVGVSVRDYETGKIVYEYYGETKRKPASNMKLLTGATALSLLGEDYRYETVVYIAGDVVNGTLNGHVYLKGSGDPTLNYNHLLSLASALKNTGIERINGNLYGDESIFTDSQLTPGIVPEDETYYYGARTSALVLSPNSDFDAGTINVRVTGSKQGAKAYVNPQPSAMGMTIVNNTVTGAKGSGTSISVTRKYGTSQVIVSGRIAPGRAVEKLVTVNNPTINTMYAMKDAIQARGIRFVKQPEVGRGILPQTATRLGAVKSQTLAQMFPEFMKLSNNAMADLFVRKLGYEQKGEGNTATGVGVLREYGQSIGVDMSKFQFEDGSGMSHRNSIAPNGLTELLFQMKAVPAFQSFYSSLPVGGMSDRLVGGSLRKRYTNSAYRTKVVAKTGAITGVDSLAGYVTAKSGKKYTFAVMVEHRRSSAISGIDSVVTNLINNN